MPKYPYALTATVFLSILLVALICLGDGLTRTLAMCAAFFAAYSQFVGPDAERSRAAWRFSIALAYLSIAFCIAAIVAFSQI